MNRAGEIEVERDADGPASGHVEGRRRLQLATRDDKRDRSAVVQDSVHGIHDQAELRVLAGRGAVEGEEAREMREGDEIDGLRGQREVDPTAVVSRVRAMDLDVREHDVQLPPIGRGIADVHVQIPRRDGTQEREPGDENQAGDRHGKHGARPDRILLRDYHSRGGVYRFSELPALNYQEVPPKRAARPARSLNTLGRSLRTPTSRRPTTR